MLQVKKTCFFFTDTSEKHSRQIGKTLAPFGGIGSNPIRITNTERERGAESTLLFLKKALQTPYRSILVANEDE